MNTWYHITKSFVLRIVEAINVLRQLHKNAASNIEQVLEATPHKAPTIRPPTSHHENYPS